MNMKKNWTIKFLDTIDQLEQVEVLQKIVWPGSDTDVVPAHLLITVVHNGGLVLGAYPDDGDESQVVGFVFGFPGIYP